MTEQTPGGHEPEGEGQEGQFTPSARNAVEEHLLGVITPRVEKRARELAGKGVPITSEVAMRAIREYASGEQVLQAKTRWQVVAMVLLNVTFLSAVLCVVFGFFGFFSALEDDSLKDIAKLFAGALVGSASAAGGKKQT